MPNWKEILEKIQRTSNESHSNAIHASDTIRRDFLKQLHGHTGRNVIAYYSGFLSKPDTAGIELNDEDMNGFMATVHQLDRSKGLDLILHTPGGRLAAAQSVIHYLTTMFATPTGANIRAIVPQIAMSAGTIIACSCKTILLAKHSQLGPIDPQFGGIAAAGVGEEFERACEEVKKDPSRIPIWQAIIGRYPPTFLSQCQNAVDRASELVEANLAANMFNGQRNSKHRAKDVVKSLMDYTGNKSHDRPIFYEECKKMGLEVGLIEDDKALQDLVLSAHHCYMHAIMNTPSFKLIENHNGVAIIKRLQQVVV